MADLRELIQVILNNVMSNIYTCLPGKIEKYDPETMRAAVIPLIKENGSELPMIIDAPVLFQKAGPFFIRSPLKMGDKVLVFFSCIDIERAVLTGEPYETKSKRRFSMDDAFVILGWRSDNQPKLSIEHSDDLVVMNTRSGDMAYMKAGGGIVFKSDYPLELVEGGQEGATRGNANKQWQDGHRHTVMVNGIPVLSSTPESAPGVHDPSPAPSEKVVLE